MFNNHCKKKKKSQKYLIRILVQNVLHIIIYRKLVSHFNTSMHVHEFHNECFWEGNGSVIYIKKTRQILVAMQIIIRNNSIVLTQRKISIQKH